MKELLKELRQDIHNCGIDSRCESDNFDSVSEAISTLDKLEEAISVTRCSLQLKDKIVLSFEDWYMFMDYQRDTYTTYIDKQGTSYFENELRQKYNCYLKHSL